METVSQDKPKTVNLNIVLSEEANELLRQKVRKKGDISRIIESLILKEFKLMS